MKQAYLPGTARQRIQELIKERNITQAELAGEIGIAESFLGRFRSEKADKIGDEYICFAGVEDTNTERQIIFSENRI